MFGFKGISLRGGVAISIRYLIHTTSQLFYGSATFLFKPCDLHPIPSHVYTPPKIKHWKWNILCFLV